MSVLDVMRKGLGYVLMSMGVSSPKPKPKPQEKPVERVDSTRPPGVS
jgi:hypothetical protein